MIQNLIYPGSSGIVNQAGGRLIRFAPNLAREAVAFDAELTQPLRFREAISALHDIVVGDLRFQKRDKSAYEDWKRQEVLREQTIRREAHDEALRQIESRRNAPLPEGFQREYDRARKEYWAARLSYAAYLQKNDPALWRQLMPCDPVITVAEDVVFFECFSRDESAYGC